LLLPFQDTEFPIARQDENYVLEIDLEKCYIQGEFGVRLEDDIVITENGGELLTVRMEGIESITA